MYYYRGNTLHTLLQIFLKEEKCTVSLRCQENILMFQTKDVQKFHNFFLLIISTLMRVNYFMDVENEKKKKWLRNILKNKNKLIIIWRHKL